MDCVWGRESIRVETVAAEAKRRYISRYVSLEHVQVETRKRPESGTGTTVILGAVRNTGERTLLVVEVSVWLMSVQNEVLGVHTYYPLKSDERSVLDSDFLRHNQMREFGYRIGDDLGPDVLSNTQVAVTDIEFASPRKDESRRAS